MLSVASPFKVQEYFEAKLEFIIDPNGLNEMLETGEVNVIDVRREEDYRKGHIPEAVNLPKEKWGTFEGLRHDKTNVVYCYSITCLLSAKACREFAENGYPVMELIGGFEEWKKHEMPIRK